MVYQNPGRALNPTIRVGDQVAEVFAIAGVAKGEARDARAGHAAQGPDLRPGAGHAPLPAPALGRDAAARRDRDGAGQRPDAADPRRADDRPRRDGRGRGPRPDLGAARASSARRCCSSATTSGSIAKMCDRVGVLYAGGWSRRGRPRRCSTTRATRTRSACCAASRDGGARKDRERLDTIPGLPAPLGADLPACVFADRCGLAEDICRTRGAAALRRSAAAGTSRCHFHEQAQELPRADRRPRACAARSTRTPSRSSARRACRKTFRQEGHDVRAPRRRLARAAPRRDARPRRRVGQRQDHARPGAARADRARPGLGRRARRRAAAADASASATREQVRALQIVFQNPDSALNRRHSVPDPEPRARQAPRRPQRRARGPPARARRVGALRRRLSTPAPRSCRAA